MAIATEVLAGDLKFPEGPAWRAQPGEIWFVELKGGCISKVDAAGRYERVAETPKPNGMKLHPDGSFWICECARKSLVRLDPETRALSVAADACEGRPFLGPNDLCFGIAERCYFTDPHGSSLESRVGAIYRRERDGRVFREFEGLAYPNGLALTPDGARLVFAETFTKKLWLADRSPDGSLGGRRPFADTGDGLGPDGMCFDAEGNLYVAVYGAGRVRVFDPAGQLVEELDTRGRNPTNCCFGGKEFKTLYVTETEKGQLLALEMGRKGWAVPPKADEGLVF
ncbi:MAG: SMP-30/gluconolactonase/LRE family protein [Planctomycetota bacterium]|nr:SMP-30/gluconolactonase/LRE family protein [Planctomycetota bacterium]